MIDQVNTRVEQQNTPPQEPHWYMTWWGVFIIIFLGLMTSLAVAFTFVIKDRVEAIKNTPISILESLPRVSLKQNDPTAPTMGAAAPKIVLTIYNDFGCPHCRNEYPIVRDFVLKHAKEIKLVNKDYPVVTENSLQLALAGRCANEQAAFWPFHDYLFEHQGSDSFKTIMDGAKSLSLDMPKFALCLQTEKFLTQIKINTDEGQQLNIEGTPTIFMNDYRLPAGEVPMDFLEKVYLELIKN